MTYKEKIEEATGYLISKGVKNTEDAVILGTGLGGLLEEIEKPITIDYKDIPHFPLSTLEYHKGKFVQGYLSGNLVNVLQGRFHLYEGYNQLEVTFPIRVLNELGVKRVFITNAAGAINSIYQKGDLMLIEDHINLQGSSPLAFKETKELGERFVDMFMPYDEELISIAKKIANENNFSIHSGVYAAVLGPQLETKAEYKYLATIGADAVGMSTVPEVIVANQLKIKVLAISVLTDECDEKRLKAINIPEIIEIANSTQPALTKIIKEILKK